MGKNKRTVESVRQTRKVGMETARKKKEKQETATAGTKESKPKQKKTDTQTANKV
jgi:hypothetical protein